MAGSCIRVKESMVEDEQVGKCEVAKSCEELVTLKSNRESESVSPKAWQPLFRFSFAWKVTFSI